MLNISPCSKMANNFIRKYFYHVLFTFQLLRSGPCRFGLSLWVAVTRKREEVGGARTRSLLCESHARSRSAKNADQSALVITSSSIADWSREEEPTGRGRYTRLANPQYGALNASRLLFQDSNFPPFALYGGSRPLWCVMRTTSP